MPGPLRLPKPLWPRHWYKRAHDEITYKNVLKCKQMFKTFWNVNRCSSSKRLEMNPSPSNYLTYTFRPVIYYGGVCTIYIRMSKRSVAVFFH